MNEAMQVVVVAVVVTKLIALGYHKRWGWLLGVVSEIPFLILVWDMPGLVAMSCIYSALSLRNYFQWGAAKQLRRLAIALDESWAQGFAEGYESGLEESEVVRIPEMDPDHEAFDAA